MKDVENIDDKCIFTNHLEFFIYFSYLEFLYTIKYFCELLKIQQ